MIHNIMSVSVMNVRRFYWGRNTDKQDAYVLSSYLRVLLFLQIEPYLMEVEQSSSNDTNTTTVTPLTGNDRYEGYIKVC